MKKRFIALFSTIILILALFGCSASAAKQTAKPAPTQTPAPTATPEPNPLDEEDILFTKDVRNDKTGNWRVAVMYSSKDISDFAVDYYKKYFEDDKEIHFVCNLGLKTTTKITCFGKTLYVDVYEYSDKEEHDANILPGGMKLASYIVDMETGEKEKLD